MVRRFKIITSLGVIVPPAPVDTVVPPVVVPPVVVPPVIVPPVVVPPVVVPDNSKDSKKNKDKKDKKENEKRMKIYSSHKTIVIENSSKLRGSIKVYDALNGHKIKEVQFNADGTTFINNESMHRGTYIVNGVTDDEQLTTRIILQ